MLLDEPKNMENIFMNFNFQYIIDEKIKRCKKHIYLDVMTLLFRLIFHNSFIHAYREFGEFYSVFD